MTNNSNNTSNVNPADLTESDYIRMKVNEWQENNPEPNEPERPTMDRACTVRIGQHYAWLETILYQHHGSDASPVSVRFFHNGVHPEEGLPLDELDHLIAELQKARANYAKLNAYAARKKAFDEQMNQWSNDRRRLEQRTRENWHKAVDQRRRAEAKKAKKESAE